jgi:hypothetical protein
MFYMYNLILGEILHREFHKKKKEKKKSINVNVNPILRTSKYPNRTCAISSTHDLKSAPSMNEVLNNKLCMSLVTEMFKLNTFVWQTNKLGTVRKSFRPWTIAKIIIVNYFFFQYILANNYS